MTISLNDLLTILVFEVSYCFRNTHKFDEFDKLNLRKEMFFSQLPLFLNWLNRSILMNYGAWNIPLIFVTATLGIWLYSMFLPAHIARRPSKSKENKSKKKKNGSKEVCENREEVTAEPASTFYEDTKSFFKLFEPAAKLNESTPKTTNEARLNDKSKSVELSFPTAKSKARSKIRNKGSNGYKKSSASEDKSKSASAFLEEELFLEDHTRNRRLKKKSLVSVLIRLGFTTLFLICSIILAYRDYPYDSVFNEHTNYTKTYPSITHHKMAILSDFPDANVNIRNIIIDIGSPNNFHREAAIIYAFYFYDYLEEREIVLPQSASSTNTTPLTVQTSLLAWGFNAASKNADPGPMTIHNATLTSQHDRTTIFFDFGQLLQFSQMANSSSMFGQHFSTVSLEALPQYYFFHILPNADFSSDNGTKRLQEFYKAHEPMHIPMLTNEFRPSSVEPQVNRIESLPFHVSEKFGFLQFASSGPKTLGTIAEIAIQVALESVLKWRKDKMDFRTIDSKIAWALMHTINEVARHPGYFENLTLNYQEVMGNVSLKFGTDIPHLVKMHTNGALTSNLLILDNRDGWPSVMHFGISAPGPLYLQYKNRNSSEMLNVCQVIVMKDGYLWLTAAASGEFYLLEKVVASIVYKIVLKTDPLETLDRENRLHYDTRQREITKEKVISDKKVDEN